MTGEFLFRWKYGAGISGNSLIAVMVKPIKFFALTFILSWLIWISLGLSHLEVGPCRIAEAISIIAYPR
jgi:hypothetical protein